MARAWVTGFELQSLTAGHEITTVTGSPTIDTTTKHSGAASFRANTSSTTAYGTKTGVTPNILIASQSTYVRFYLRIATAPGALTTIFAVRDAGGALVSIRLNSDRTLELWNDIGADAQIGSDSSALTLDTWYRIEIAITANATPVITDISARIDGSNFAAASGLSGAFTAGNIHLDWGVITSESADLYFDDIAVNTSAGANENSYPGEGYMVYLHAAGNGDNIGMGSRGG